MTQNGQKNTFFGRFTPRIAFLPHTLIGKVAQNHARGCPEPRSGGVWAVRGPQPLGTPLAHPNLAQNGRFSTAPPPPDPTPRSNSALAFDPEGAEGVYSPFFEARGTENPNFRSRRPQIADFTIFQPKLHPAHPEGGHSRGAQKPQKTGFSGLRPPKSRFCPHADRQSRRPKWVGKVWGQKLALRPLPWHLGGYSLFKNDP